MISSRREFVKAAMVGAAMPSPLALSLTGERKMYGLIGKMKAVAGQRDALISIILNGVSGMPGCLSYVVAQDPTTQMLSGSLRSGTIRSAIKHRSRCPLSRMQFHEGNRLSLHSIKVLRLFPLAVMAFLPPRINSIKLSPLRGSA